MNIDILISKVFNKYWHGDDTLSSIENMRKQLHKNLTDQLNGYWSGSTAYAIMVHGGFLKDAKRGTNKELTELGKMFMEDYRSKLNEQNT